MSLAALGPLSAAASRTSAGNEQSAMRDAAEAFESLLMQQLVTRMREAQLEAGLFGEGSGAQIYEGLFDEYMAKSLSERSPLGIADALMRQWDADPDGADQARSAATAVRRARAQQAYGGALATLTSAPVDLSGGEPPAIVHARADGSQTHHDEIVISRPFGRGPDPFHGRRVRHDGVDFAAAATGTAVLAPRSGRVARVDHDHGGYGLQVIVEHAGGLRTRYAHLSATEVRTGESVGPGTRLGLVGSTGRSTGPHLHFEALLDGRPTDPLELFGPRIGGQVLGDPADE